MKPDSSLLTLSPLPLVRPTPGIPAVSFYIHYSSCCQMFMIQHFRLSPPVFSTVCSSHCDKIAGGNPGSVVSTVALLQIDQLLSGVSCACVCLVYPLGGHHGVHIWLLVTQWWYFGSSGFGSATLEIFFTGRVCSTFAFVVCR